MPNAIFLGSDSDIAKGIRPYLEGWRIYDWNRDVPKPVWPRWDLVICFIGKVQPVGLWWTSNSLEWTATVMDNVIAPISLLRNMWPMRNDKAAVCFLAGSNPNAVDIGYSAYSIGKMALLKACEQLDAESPDAKFFALAPGIVLTKIHRQSRDWPNPKLAKAIASGQSTPMERIYKCLQWCLSQPKQVIGGRNVCVSDPWDKEEFLASQLALKPNLYKLRRQEAHGIFPENEGT